MPEKSVHRSLHVMMSQDAISNDEQRSKRGDNEAEMERRRRKMSDMSQGPGLIEMVAGDEPDDLEQLRLASKSSSVIKFYPDWCQGCLQCWAPREGHNVGEMTFTDYVINFIKCPPGGTLGRIIMFTFIILFLWGLFFHIFRPFSENEKRLGKDDYIASRNPAWVKGPIFALMIIEITGLFTGVMLKKFLNFPSLLGPLILGIIYNNCEPLNVFNDMKGLDFRDCGKYTNETLSIECVKLAKHTINVWVKPIRLIALGIILTRAGLELSPKQLKKLKGIVPLLAFGPCIIEASTCALCNYIFFNVLEEHPTDKMGLAMCFVGGFALAAVSPAVVVPGALTLKRDGYGVAKGIPTLLIAASSIDDVLAISIYTIALGLAVPVQREGFEPWKGYSGGLIGIVIGIVHGVIFGMILHFVPARNSKNKPHHRIILLLLVNFTSVMAYDDTWFSSAGSISILTTSFIAGFGWRSQAHWKRSMHKLEGWLAHLWVLWIPLIFGTIGKEIDFSDATFKGLLLARTFGVIFISLAVRLMAAFVCVSFGTGFNMKEKLFIALSWIPKATVQAALAPLVLTRASEGTNANAQFTATLVVNTAILAVLITAPIGCILIGVMGPHLLDKFQTPEYIIEEEFPNGEGFDPAESTFGLAVAQARLSMRHNDSQHEIRFISKGSKDDEDDLQQIIDKHMAQDVARKVGSNESVRFGSK